ncbi:MAG: MFS transporter [Proteobacteria bacterium]|nr:MFS transporter [Pseudomonadota bacterium]
MLFRFSLYGFLKNQQYFEPFILLALLDMGLSFTVIGGLIGLREVLRNLAEVPSGAIADLMGRRGSLLFSFACYIVSFSLLGLTSLYAQDQSVLVTAIMIAFAFALYAFGDAFRSGTHKALIFNWLRQNGRTDERTRVYGYTRSWSKLGSALSVVLACLLVYWFDDYTWIFFLSIPPFVLNMLNVGNYPKELDGQPHEGRVKFSEVVAHLRDAFALVFTRPALRRLMFESMSFEGYFKASKDYLQPILKIAAIPLAVVLFSDLDLSEVQASVILIGPVYFLLFLGSAVASRQAHRLVKLAGGEEAATRLMWLILAGLFVVLLPALYLGLQTLAIVALVGYHFLQNVWRPVYVGRIDSHGEEDKGATLLSIQSQAQSLATMIFAPLLGLAIDLTVDRSTDLADLDVAAFWPIAVVGILVTLVFVRRPQTSEEPRPVGL